MKYSFFSPIAQPPRVRWFIYLALLVASAVALLYGGAVSLSHSRDSVALREAYLPELEERARQKPSNGSLLAMLAIRRCEAKQYGAAGLDWERAAGAGEQGVILWRIWAATVAASGDRPKAQAILKLGMARDKNAAPALNDSLVRLDAQPPDASATVLAETLSPQGIQPAYELYGRGGIWNAFFSGQERRNPERSGFATRQEWAAAEPENLVAQKWWAEALLINQRGSEAETVLRKILARQAEDAELLGALGDALRQQNRHGEAGKAYQSSLRLAKDNRRALLGLGSAMLDKSLVRVSVPLFEKAIQLYPEDVDAWIGLGRAHFQLHTNYGRAVVAFERAKALAPQRTDFFLVYANSLRGAGRYSEAEAIIRRRLKAAPDDAAAHYQVALLILQTQPTGERRSSAEQELRESLRLVDAPAVKGRLGQLLVEQARGREAIPLLEAALSADNKSVANLRALASAFRLTGEMDQANRVTQSLADLTAYRSQVQKLEDLQMVHPDAINIHRQLGDLYLRGGEMEKAIFHQEAVRRIEANPESARRTLTQIGAAMSRSSGQ